MPELERDFFVGKGRRKLTIMDYKPLMNAEGFKRKRLSIYDELDADALIGLPDWISEVYTLIAAGDGTGQCDYAKCRKTELEGMTLEVYPTERGKSRSLLLTHGKIKNFAVERQGKEEKARYYLTYTAEVPDSTELHNWLDKGFRQEVFVQFDQDQMSLGDKPDDDDDDEDEDQPSIPGVKAFDGQAIARAAGNKPRGNGKSIH